MNPISWQYYILLIQPLCPTIVVVVVSSRHQETGLLSLALQHMLSFLLCPLFAFYRNIQSQNAFACSVPAHTCPMINESEQVHRWIPCGWQSEERRG